MKERLFFSPNGDTRVEVCNCDGELQLRLFGQGYNGVTWSVMRVLPALVRIVLTKADLRRLADFFDEIAERAETEEL